MQTYPGYGCKYKNGFVMSCTLCKFIPDLGMCNEYVKNNEGEKVRPDYY